jgi:hypothetical protein
MRSSEVRARAGSVALGCAFSCWVACSPDFEAGDDGAGEGGDAAAGTASGGSSGRQATAGEGSGGRGAGASGKSAAAGGAGGSTPVSGGSGRSAGGAGPAGGTGAEGGVEAGGQTGEGEGGSPGGTSAVGGGAGTAGGAAGNAGTGGSTASAYAALVLAAEPLVYWRMGVTSGVVVPDATGGGNDLVLQGSGHEFGVEGAVGEDDDFAMGFDGEASFAIATNARALDFAEGAAFTLECWARRLSGGPSYFQQLFSNIEGSPGSRNGYLLYLLPEAEAQDDARSSFEYDRIGVEVGVWGPMPAEAIWAHYAAVVDGETATLYVDGTLTDAAPVDGMTTARSGPFAVARASNESAYYFKGALDELAVYARALGVAEIAAHAAFKR